MTANLERIVELARQIVDLASEPEPTPTPAPIPAPPTGDAAILTNFGMVNTAALVVAAQATGVPLWVAAAFVEKESNGRNVYGNDTGGTFAGAGAVTEENYREFYRLVVEEKQKSNGVGPLQITYPAYFPKAAAEGLKLWVPLDNFTFGLRIIAGHLKGDYTAASLERAGTLYNVGNLTNGINAYGRDVALKAAKWAGRLGVTLPPDPTPTPDPEPPTKDTTGETIRRGDRGAAVAVAQRRLTAHGYPATADGIFGLATETAARNFQDARGLTIDGVIGRDTWRELLEQTPQERTAEARAILTGLGWRTDTTSRFVQAVKDFQRMWAFGSPLDVDGIPGPVTIAALRESKRLGGKVSPNFKASEFACKCGGRYANCRRIWAHRALVLGAEKYRTIAGPFTPISACRCWDHNKAVGGYYRSQHLHGLAMDVTARFSVAKVTALGVFPAIGYNRSTGTVRHVDFRNLGPDNYPRASGSTSNPYTYIYG